MIRGLVSDTVVLSADSASCTLQFAASEPFFAGHFPGHPIVPGVILLECLAGLAQQWLGGVLSEISESKFRHEVTPLSEIRCLVRRDGSGEIVATAQVAGQTVVEAYFTLTETHQ